MNRTFDWGKVIATFFIHSFIFSFFLEYCASPLFSFDPFPSAKIEENQCGAKYPKANSPSPAAPAVHSKRPHFFLLSPSIIQSFCGQPSRCGSAAAGWGPMEGAPRVPEVLLRSTCAAWSLVTQQG